MDVAEPVNACSLPYKCRMSTCEVDRETAPKGDFNPPTPNGTLAVEAWIFASDSDCPHIHTNIDIHTYIYTYFRSDYTLVNISSSD